MKIMNIMKTVGHFENNFVYYKFVTPLSDRYII